MTQSVECPYATAPLEFDEELFLANSRRLQTEYATDDEQGKAFHIYYGDKEIVFDEPELFAFGEALAIQTRFAAGAATTWGRGYPWPQVRDLLGSLVRSGILLRASAVSADVAERGRTVRSPLPPATSTTPRSWRDCERLTRELTGQPIELSYLELLVPVYRIAHPELDAEGRQIGEANVFPPALRVEVATEWRSCGYPGSRFQDDFPMNVSALKSMLVHWKAMMFLLQEIRRAYVRRYPDAAQGMTVGHAERLANLVLAIPTYLLMRERGEAADGHLEPLLSSMFRVTDGLRMTAHFMLVGHAGGGAASPDDPVTGAQVHAYAEKSAAFLSTHGVCAGPRALVDEFLGVLVDGKAAAEPGAAGYEATVARAMDALDDAFDYGLRALQAYAVAMSLWPLVAGAYDALLAPLGPARDLGHSAVARFGERVRERVTRLRDHTMLGWPEERRIYERLYADMYRQSGRALRRPGIGNVDLAVALAPVCDAAARRTQREVLSLLERRAAGVATAETPWLRDAAAVLGAYLAQERALVRLATDVQTDIGSILGRPPPRRPLAVPDIALHYRFFKPAARVPYLTDDLRDELGISARSTIERCDIVDVGAP